MKENPGVPVGEGVMVGVKVEVPVGEGVKVKVEVRLGVTVQE
jgi:hypothetical protein